MEVKNTALPGLFVVDTEYYIDHRGAFARLFCERELQKALGKRNIVQINHSITKSIGAVRGLHFQHPPFAEMKFIRCLKGHIWDVAVDLRRKSPTFLQWHAEELSQKNQRMMVIPEGFAHGFQVIEQDSELLYLHTAFYSPEYEDGIHPNDPKLNINWPLSFSDLSEKDAKRSLLTPEFIGLSV